MTALSQGLRAAGRGTPGGLDVDRVRKDFPILGQQIYGKPRRCPARC